VDTQTAIDLLWQSYQAAAPAPAELKGALDLDAALTVQLGILERRLEAGAALAGWKIGLTSARVRERFGTTRQPFGHILEASVHGSGDQVDLANFRGATGVEPELCLTLGTALAGPGANAEDARLATGAISAGMEINEIRITDAGDFPLLVADNLAQWGIVVGATLSPVPDGFDSDAVRARIDCEGETKSEDLGADVIDDHFLSLAALANELAPFGRRLEPGQRVITGSFSNHRVPQASRWEAQFSGIGSVAINFA
jgi:2-keto-4-pentenoate hydratase